jgi:hypothetical protein
LIVAVPSSACAASSEASSMSTNLLLIIPVYTKCPMIYTHIYLTFCTTHGDDFATKGSALAELSEFTGLLSLWCDHKRSRRGHFRTRFSLQSSNVVALTSLVMNPSHSMDDSN